MKHGAKKSAIIRDTAKDNANLNVDRTIGNALSGFGQHLRALRKAHRVTQQQIEARSGLTQSGVSKLETGDGNMDLRSLLQYAIGLQLKPSFLLAFLDGCSSASGAVIMTLGATPTAVGPDVSGATVDTLAEELNSGPASRRKQRGVSRNR